MDKYKKIQELHKSDEILKYMGFVFLKRVQPERFIFIAGLIKLVGIS